MSCNFVIALSLGFMSGAEGHGAVDLDVEVMSFYQLCRRVLTSDKALNFWTALLAKSKFWNLLTR